MRLNPFCYSQLKVSIPCLRDIDRLHQQSGKYCYLHRQAFICYVHGAHDVMYNVTYNELQYTLLASMQEMIDNASQTFIQLSRYIHVQYKTITMEQSSHPYPITKYFQHSLCSSYSYWLINVTRTFTTSVNNDTSISACILYLMDIFISSFLQIGFESSQVWR